MKIKLVLFFLLTLSLGFHFPSDVSAVDVLEPAALEAPTMQQISKASVPFVSNQGQVDSSVDFYAKLFAGTFYITDDNLVYDLIQDEKRYVIFESLGVSLNPIGHDMSSSNVNYFIGPEENWQSSIPTYNSVSVSTPWSGISLHTNAHAANVEKIFTVSPNADPGEIEISVEGPETLFVSQTGEMSMSFDDGAITSMTAPVAFQIIDGKQIDVDVSYDINGNSYGFTVGTYDTNYDLIIDPLLASTYLGGSSTEEAYAIDIDSSGNVYVAGYTISTDFPTTNGAYDEVIGTYKDVFVSKFSSDLTTLSASTYLGGNGHDRPYDLTLDSSGNVYVAGSAASTDFPTTVGAPDTSNNGNEDVFVSKFSSDLTTLSASTYLGGNGVDVGYAIDIDSSGNVYVAGSAYSGFPTTNDAYDEVIGGTYDAFVSKFSSDLTTLSASTYLGGTGVDVGYDLTLDSSGNVYVAGSAASGFPTTNDAYDEVIGGTSDAFVSKLSSDLTTLSASTYLGGNGVDVGYVIDIDSSGNVYVAGSAYSGFPTTNDAYDEVIGGITDVFVSKLSSDLTTLSASTYLGGAEFDRIRSIDIDSSGNVYVAGYTQNYGSGHTRSTAFPTTNGAYDAIYNAGSTDAFVSKLSSDLTTLSASTFLKVAQSNAYAMTLDSSGNVYVAGSVSESGFPTTVGAYDRSYGGITDAFVSKLSSDLSDGSDTTAPTFSVTSVSPTSGNTAKVGDNVVVTLTAGSNETGLTASGTQTINGVTSSFSESGSGVYTITYTVVEGNTDRADSGALPVSITLQDSAGNAGTAITTIASGTAPGVDANSPTFAAAGDVTSTVEINSSTTNGPTLTNSDFFGTSVANIGDLNNDGVNDIAVGAYGDDDGGGSRGAVHIMFMNTDGSVDSTVEINSSTTNGPTLTNSDYFGWSVANIGDLNNDGVNDIAVGAYGDDEGGSDRGAVHIMFMNTDGSVDSTVEINSSTTNGPTLTNSDYFGTSVANIGDLNNDGVNDIAVGAWTDDAGGDNRGAVHIMFMNTDGSVDSTVEINSSTTNGPTLTNSDYFGESVANIGDLNNDGVNDIAVGAQGDSEGGSDRGAVHIMFMNTDGSVDSTVEINSSTTNGPTLTNSDYFGSSVTNIGDLDGDGVNDLAVGTYGDDEGGSDRGAVHIMFMNTDGSVDSTVEINSSTTNGPTLTNSDAFGHSVANIGDLDGDGVNDLAVGAWMDDEGGDGRGAVHIISMVGTSSPGSTTAATSSATQIAITVDQSVSNNSASAGDFTLGGVSGGSIGSIVSVSGTTITLGVTGATISENDTVTIAYTQSSGSVDDANGNQLQDFTAQSVTNNLDTTAPTISFTSVTPTSGTQVVGETVVIRVTAGSSETGLTLSTSTINGVTPTFNEVGSGVYDLTYTIVEGNSNIVDASAGVPYSIILNDANGNPSNTLAATIATNSSPGVDANSPTISFTSVTPTSGTQVVGETVVIRVTAGSSETGLTLSTSTINGVTPTFNEVGSGVYDLTYTIVEGNTNIVDASAGVPYSIILQDTNGNPSNTLAATIATNSSPGVDANSPTISFTSVTPTSGTQVVGETVVIRVTAGSSETGLTLSTSTINGVTPTFNEVGSGVYDLTYTIVEGNTNIVDASAGVPYSIILQDTNGNPSNTLAATIATNSSPGVDANSPTISFTSVTPTSGTQVVGETVVIRVTAGSSETGLTLSTSTINGVTPTFNEVGSGVYDLTYTIVEGNTNIVDASAGVPYSIILQDTNGNPSNTLAATIATNSSPGVDANSPAFSSAAITSATQIAITVDQSVSNNSASAGDFTLGGVSGGSIGSIVSVSGTTITLGVTGATISENDTVTIAYTQSSGSVDDANGNQLQDFTAQSVTNNLDEIPPTISFTSVTPTSGTQVVGETVVIRVTAGSSETGLTLSTSTINGVTPTFTDNNDGTYDLTYTIVEGNSNIVDASAGVPYSIILNDANGNPSNTLAATIATNSSPGVDANSPTISFTSVTPTSGTQVVGETVVIRVTAGSSETGLTLSTSTINGVTPTFNEVGSGVYDLTYTIVEGNTNIVDASAGVPYSIILNDANGNPSNTLAATIATNSSPGVQATSPSQVGTVTLTTGSTQVTLSWNAPSVDGSPITDYVVQYSTDNSTWSTFADGTSTSTTATVTGLTNDTLYYFKVAAVNVGGTGSFSDSASAKPGTPSQVIVSTTTESDTMAYLSWVAPGNGGSDITDYVIQYSTDNSNWTTFSDGTSTDTSVTLTDLSTCNDYFYRVSAVNGIGTGIASSSTKNTLDVSAGYDYGGRGVQDFTTKQQFGSGVTFESAQTFGAVQEFGASQTFGEGNTFANSQNFCGAHNFIADEIEFGTSTTFDTAQTFGDAAKFAANQDFTNVNHDFTSTAIFFDAGAVFSANEVMGVGADFSSGAQNFGNAMTFDEATEFGDLQDWGAQTHTFEKYMHFGDTNDFAEKIQTFQEGTSFGEGTIFKDNQSIPINTIPSFGVLLQAITCGSDTSSETCMPNDATKYLSPGEFLTAGQDPAPTSISISKNNKDFSVDGIGLEMTFTDITTNGTIESDLYDPANIPSSTLVGDTGKVSVSTSNVGTVETIGSVMNISTGTSNVSGAITVSLKYSEDNIPAGTAESDLTMLHYIGGVWTTEDSCTVDTVNNKVTCTVTSLSPFGIGGPGSGSSSSSSSSSGSGGGGNNCDSKGFGVGRSLMVYQVDFSEDTNIVTLQAYSTCGTISAKITTESGSQIMGLSMEQPLIDENIVMYSATLPEGMDNFTINVYNNKNTFDEKYYPHGNDLTKSYTGETGYLSQQQGMFETSITSEQTTILPETTMVSEPAVKITPETIDEIKDDSAEKPIVDEKSSIPVGQTAAYTPEPTSPTCGPGTFEKNGICVMDNGSIKTPQESVSGGLENEFVILVIVLGAVAILAIILLAKRKKKSDSENN